MRKITKTYSQAPGVASKGRKDSTNFIHPSEKASPERMRKHAISSLSKQNI